MAGQQLPEGGSCTMSGRGRGDGGGEECVRAVVPKAATGPAELGDEPAGVVGVSWMPVLGGAAGRSLA